MRAFRLLISLGGILLIVGVYLVLPPSSVSGSQNASIPSGANYFYRIGFDVYKAGRISGTFSETNGSGITLYIFTQDQYAAFKAGQSTNNLFTAVGSTGSFSASVAYPGTYYITMQHGSAFTGQTQNVQVSWLLDGSNPTILGIGFTVLAAAVVMIVIGYRKMARAQPPPSATDVIRFDKPESENPPPPPPASQSF